MSDGTPVNECPGCGCKQFKNYGTRRLSTGTVRRYIICRNPNCGKRFLEVQPPPRIVREIEPRDEDERLVFQASIPPAETSN
jgi:hypothetical protein